MDGKGADNFTLIEKHHGICSLARERDITDHVMSKFVRDLLAEIGYFSLSNRYRARGFCEIKDVLWHWAH